MGSEMCIRDRNKFKTFQLLEAEIELLVKFDFFFGKLFLRLQTTERNAFNLIPSDKRPIQAENLLLWNKTVIVIGKENETREPLFFFIIKMVSKHPHAQPCFRGLSWAAETLKIRLTCVRKKCDKWTLPRNRTKKDFIIYRIM